ncbi:putative 3',5'-cyclic phosphodiesterase pde-4 [Toxocara canis]|uniref:3',5'-cyclic-AMP phosphodiesterase n=1 Tax=Toxocara canis TaxID=6265 RepID=A0A0B2VNB6_TOXCA|nr:putative 3',5'-cyclic phosphodiesterase pde-4 [Toxocara canis]
MASSKFRKMLNKELSHFAESSKSGTQVSQFIISTYMDKEDDDPQMPQLEVSHAEPPTPSTSTTSESPQLSLLGKAKTAAMSRISGVRKLRSTYGGQVPEFGVEGQRELAVHMQRVSTQQWSTSDHYPFKHFPLAPFIHYMTGCADASLKCAFLNSTDGLLDEWGPNIFKINELSKGHSLTAITYTIMKNRGLLKTFEIPPGALVTYLLHLEHHYRDNPYHNQIHGGDVAQSTNVLISCPSLTGVFSELEVLAAIFASAVHDVDHPGFTNQYLINSNSELAIMYNDESVLEQHHLAVAFKLLQDSNCDFLVGLTKKQRQLFRKISIEMVYTSLVYGLRKMFGSFVTVSFLSLNFTLM